MVFSAHHRTDPSSSPLQILYSPCGPLNKLRHFLQIKKTAMGTHLIPTMLVSSLTVEHFLFQPYSGTTPNSFSSIMVSLVLPPEPMWNSSMSSTSPLTSSLSSNLPGSFLASLSPLSFCLCLRRQIIYCSLLLTYWMPAAIWTIPPSILSHVRMPALPPGFTSASVLKMRLEG